MAEDGHVGVKSKVEWEFFRYPYTKPSRIRNDYAIMPAILERWPSG